MLAATSFSGLTMSRRDMGFGGRSGPPALFCTVLLLLLLPKESLGKDTRQFGFNTAAAYEGGWTTFDPIPYKKQERLTTAESFTFTDSSSGTSLYVCKTSLDFAIRVTTGQTRQNRRNQPPVLATPSPENS